MKIHIQYLDWKIWGIIEKGYEEPTKLVKGTKKVKPKSE